MMIIKYPDTIWLQVTNEDGDLNDWPDWTHCQDKIHETDIEYVRVTPEIRKFLKRSREAETAQVDAWWQCRAVVGDGPVECQTCPHQSYCGFVLSTDLNDDMNKCRDVLKGQTPRHRIIIAGEEESGVH